MWGCWGHSEGWRGVCRTGAAVHSVFAFRALCVAFSFEPQNHPGGGDSRNDEDVCTLGGGDQDNILKFVKRR